MKINEIESEIIRNGYDKHIRIERESENVLNVWDFGQKISFVQKNEQMITAKMYESFSGKLKLIAEHDLEDATLQVFNKSGKEFIVIHYSHNGTNDYNIGLVLKH